MLPDNMQVCIVFGLAGHAGHIVAYVLVTECNGHLQRVAKLSDAGLVSLGNCDASALQGLDNVLVHNICPVYRDFLPPKRVDKLVAILGIFGCIVAWRAYTTALIESHEM